MKERDYTLFQTMGTVGNIKECKTYVDGDWSIYERPHNWGSDNDMNSYFVHRCSRFFKDKWHHYWINYEKKERDYLYDIRCSECHTSAPHGLQAIYHFLNPRLITTLVFVEKGT